VLLVGDSEIHQELFHGGLIGSIVLSEEPMTICGTNGGMADAGAIGKTLEPRPAALKDRQLCHHGRLTG
jgi:hypothetical protein